MQYVLFFGVEGLGWGWGGGEWVLVFVRIATNISLFSGEGSDVSMLGKVKDKNRSN